MHKMRQYVPLICALFLNSMTVFGKILQKIRICAGEYAWHIFTLMGEPVNTVPSKSSKLSQKSRQGFGRHNGLEYVPYCLELRPDLATNFPVSIGVTSSSVGGSHPPLKVQFIYKNPMGELLAS